MLSCRRSLPLCCRHQNNQSRGYCRRVEITHKKEWLSSLGHLQHSRDAPPPWPTQSQRLLWCQGGCQVDACTWCQAHTAFRRRSDLFFDTALLASLSSCSPVGTACCGSWVLRNKVNASPCSRQDDHHTTFPSRPACPWISLPLSLSLFTPQGSETVVAVLDNAIDPFRFISASLCVCKQCF